MVCAGGVSTDDFTQILTDMGRTVSYKVVTKTNNAETGTEVTTFAAAGDKTMIFFLEENRWVWDKEGLLEVGDAYIIAPIATGIKRYDQLTVDGDTYYIENVTRRTVLTTAMVDYGVLFKVA